MCDGVLWGNEIVYTKQENIEYIQFKKLLEYSEITHCYTLRSGNELNFVPAYRDKAMLKESYHKICQCLHLDETQIVKPHQTHTDHVEAIQQLTNLEEIDGVITNQPNLTLLTTSADCTSLLFYEPANKVIGSVHSGWKGTLKGIAVKAVQKMIQAYQCNPQDIICCICPSIRECCFEVDEDVKQLFKKQYEKTIPLQEIIKQGNIREGKQKYLINTTKINQLLLQKQGLRTANIVDSKLCTVCHSDKFHSYRVDKDASGRNAALICLTNTCP